MRLTRAVRELNAEHGYGIRVIALHTESERRATFVRAADEAVVLQETGAGNPYLDHEELGRALRTARADAAWVGWGFVAEDPAFAELCASLGVTFIGPPPEAMRLLGAKIEAKVLAEQTGVPVAAWSGGPVAGIEDGRRHAETIGYPLIVKSRSGGGGRGIRIVRSEAELEEALTRTQDEALKTFGDATIFMERLVEGGRHVEVQVIADQHGGVWAPGVRDCSVQRRNQKVLEESSSPALTIEQSDSLRESSMALVKAAGYVGAGTVEFLYQPEERLFTFLEVNTRLQVEHPVTEETTGLDIVKLQLHVADGGRLVGEPPREFGHAVEARLNAEDAEQGFAPAPGQVELLRLPTGPGVRVDTGMSVGDVISPAYDSMVAKVIAWGRDRPEALARLRCALRDTTVVLAGGTTTKSFLLDLLDRPEVVEGTADTGWLDRTGTAPARPAVNAWVALVQVALDLAEAEVEQERLAFLASARGGRPRAPHEVGRTIELGMRGQVYRLTVATVDRDRYRVGLDGRVVDVEVDRLGPLESHLTAGGRRYSVVAAEAPGSSLVEVDGETHRVSRDVGGVVRAPAPAVVVAVRVAPGDEVEAGQPIAVLESMKMETAVRAPFAGRVREVLAAANSQVDAGAPLLNIEQVGGDVEEATGDRVELPRVEVRNGGHRDRALSLLAALQALITGYDVSGRYASELVAEYDTARNELPNDDAELLRGELTVLTTFADLTELSRNRPSGSEEEADQQVHSPREFFHAYLHSLDVDREGLPESFRGRLSRALLHYDVRDLEPLPELEEAVYRLYLAQQRIADQLPAVQALLERWLGTAPPSGAARAEVADVLDRLVVATQLRYPAVGDLARAVRYRYFEEPVVQENREVILDQAAALLAQLEETGVSGEDDEAMRRVEALVESPEPLIRLLAQRAERETTIPDPVVEVLTRRYYRSRDLQNVHAEMFAGRSAVFADYDLRGTRLHLLAWMGPVRDLPGALAEVVGRSADVPEPRTRLLDLYVSWPDRPADADAMVAELHRMLAPLEPVPAMRRVTVTVCAPGGEVETVTFRPAPDKLAEDRLIRGLHPLTAQRLNLWRLKNFDGERLPSAEDTYLFHLTAKDNPNDERFIAMAEVRDLAPLRDEAGDVVGYPTVERQLTACLDSLRRGPAPGRPPPAPGGQPPVPSPPAPLQGAPPGGGSPPPPTRPPPPRG